MSKKFIVITTIYPVSEAVKRFDAMNDWQLIVVADKKTPKDYTLKNGLLLTVEMQEELDKELSDAIGWNCIERRNMGALYAYKQGAEVVAAVDDDNIPQEGWGKSLHLGKPTEVNYYETDLPVFDPIGATNYPHLWHRGFPIQLLSKRDYSRVRKEVIIPDVQADFWNGDPDVDAICRMEHAPMCEFDPKFFPLAANTIAPFNSQNTFISRKALPHYFIFPHIGRMDDIWGSYYAQARGCTVLFEKPSVVQERNDHDLTIDFQGELLGYQNSYRFLPQLKSDPESIWKYMPERSKLAFDLYHRHFV